jgi:integrase
MASLFRRKYTTTDQSGKRVTRRTTKWYGRYVDELGVQRRVPLSPNKAAAQQMLAELVKQVERRKAGLFTPAEEHGRRPLTEHLADYERELFSRGIGAEQVQLTVGRVRAVLDGCTFVFPRDVQAAPIREFLASLRQEPARPDVPAQEWFTPVELAKLLDVTRGAVTSFIRRHGLRATGKGRGRARRFPRSTALALVDITCRGLGSQTVAYYWREAKAFCRWMASAKQQRLTLNPLADEKGPNAREEPRHDRRPLPPDELRRLLDVARASAWSWRGLTGSDRWHLYLVACVTGYRRKELASLTPKSFDFDGEPPLVTLPGKRTKNKRLAEQPLPADVVAVLRDYLAGKAPNTPLWPRPILKQIVVALRHDLEEAGIPYVVDGPEGPLYFDFHALRHSYVLMLDQSGATLKEAMQLARHSDPKLTAARYGRLQLHDLGAAVERLPSLVRPSGQPLDRLQATGTEGNQLPPTSELAPKLTPVPAFQREEVRLRETEGGADPFDATPSPVGHLRPFETACDRMTGDYRESKKRESPATAAGPLSVGEELVPEGK